MEHREYTTMDKSDWGDGPWQNEPDKIQFVDRATGLPCLIVRNHSGALCGYVGVPQGHKAWRLHYDDDAFRRISVHGGLTFADHCHDSGDETRGICHVPAAGDADNVWWLGFDCSHVDDVMPAHRKIFEQINLPGYDKVHKNDRYRTVNYVKRHIAKLALQLNDM